MRGFTIISTVALLVGSTQTQNTTTTTKSSPLSIPGFGAGGDFMSYSKNFLGGGDSTVGGLSTQQNFLDKFGKDFGVG
jgi:hypothetical protein